MLSRNGIRHPRVPPCTHLRAGGPLQKTDSLGGRGWFSQRAVQQVRCHFGRTIFDRFLSGLIQSGKHPLITRGSYKSQMGRDLPGGRSIGVQQTGGRAMACISCVATERRLQGVADHRMNEPRRVIIG